MNKPQQIGIENIAEFVAGIKEEDVLPALFALGSDGSLHGLIVFPDVEIHSTDDVEISKIQLEATWEIRNALWDDAQALWYQDGKTTLSYVSKMDRDSNGRP